MRFEIADRKVIEIREILERYAIFQFELGSEQFPEAAITISTRDVVPPAAQELIRNIVPAPWAVRFLPIK